MGKLFLGENKFEKVQIKWSNPRLQSGKQKGNVRIVFTEVMKDSPEYVTTVPADEIDPWSPIQAQIVRENFIANVVIDNKVAFACTVADLHALQRAISVHLDRASAYIY